MELFRGKNPEANRLAFETLLLESKLLKAAKKFDLALKNSSTAVQSRLFNREPEFIKRVQADLGTVLRVFERCEVEHTDPWNDRKFIQLFMRELGVIYPKDFLDKIETGDVIEGYDMHHQQVFRNMRFMEVSGYSLLEIASSEWTELYDRPRAITEKMLSFCDDILWAENRTIPFTVPAHYVRELRSPDKHTYDIKFKRLTPLFAGPNNPFGLIGSSSVRVIEEGEAEHGLSFV